MLHTSVPGPLYFTKGLCACEPWQIKRTDLVPFSQTLSTPTFKDAGPRSYSEADLHEYTQRRRRLETTSPLVPAFAAGTWSLDRFDGLWQLRRLAIADLVFPSGDPYAPAWDYFSDMQPQLIEKYAAWLRAGYEPPPIQACEVAGGHIRVTNGHNRAAALVRVGRHEILAWVSVVYTKADGSCTDLTHALAVEMALCAGKPVPAPVVADYPHLVDLHRHLSA